MSITTPTNLSLLDRLLGLLKGNPPSIDNKVLETLTKEPNSAGTNVRAYLITETLLRFLDCIATVLKYYLIINLIAKLFGGV